MDVAKYIGLFLLKNNSCYIQGLGNIEIRRKPASYDGRNLIAGSYEVVVVPTNSVDDSLSNFIATNEQISISKASNALKEFTANAKTDLLEGKEVQIPSLGAFYEVNEKLQFVTANQLQINYATMPAEKSMPRRKDDNVVIAPQPGYHQQPVQEYTTPPVSAPPSYNNPLPEREEESKGGIIWWRVILFGLLLAALVGGILFAVKNILKTGGTPNKDTTQINSTITQPDTLANQLQATDTTGFIDTAATMSIESAPVEASPTAVNKGQLLHFQVILNVYDERARAEKRVQKLKKYGNAVKLVAEDSNMYYVLLPVSAYAADTARVMDSLQRNFNPDGIYIY